MDFMEGVRRFLFGPRHNHHDSNPQSNLERYYDNTEDSLDNFRGNPSTSPRSFDVFTDPLQIHQYFEQQMNEMLRNFGFQNFGGGLFGGESMLPDFGEQRSFSELVPTPPESGELRDQFLKQGYEKPSEDSNVAKLDKDIDDKITYGDLDSIFGNKTQVVPRTPAPSQRFFSGQSFSSKTIRAADGSVEVHSTRRDSEGNEQTTITKRFGDKEVTVTKKRDKYGKEEIVENFVNVDESEKDNFLSLPSHPEPSGTPHNYFPFDKFFK